MGTVLFGVEGWLVSHFLPHGEGQLLPLLLGHATIYPSFESVNFVHEQFDGQVLTSLFVEEQQLLGSIAEFASVGHGQGLQ